MIYINTYSARDLSAVPKNMLCEHPQNRLFEPPRDRYTILCAAAHRALRVFELYVRGVQRICFGAH